MTTPAERFSGWIDGFAKEVDVRLKTWMAGWLSWGIELFFVVLEKAATPMFKPIIDRLEAESTIPPELKPIFDELKGPESAIGAVLANSAGGALIGGALGRIIDYVLRPLTYGLSFSPGFYIHEAPVLVNLWRRGFIDETYLTQHLRWHGLGTDDIEQLKKVTEYLPGPAELIHWTAREVFEPDKIAKYGLMDDADKLRREDFYKVAIGDEQIDNNWIAHWEHASWMQIVEMLHRGIITEQDVKDWFPLVEMAPYWAEHLIQAAYTWPTRVDVRRWWDMRTIDETELRRLYSGMGYRGVNLDNYVLWTKVYVAFPDLLARWTKGWITLDEVKSELTGLGMPADRVEEMIQTKIKAAQPERTANEKDITKTDIIKGVKKGVISRSEGVELLIDLGYDEDEAAYILDINIPVDEEEPVVKTRELTKADILTGLKTAVITESEALTKLEGLRYTPDDARTILDIFKATAEPPVEAWQREASKADIVAAVKKGLITPENAYLMLLDIGFSAEAANFILMVRAEVSPFSPMSYTEFKDITQKWKRAVGKEAKPMSKELIAAGAEVVKLTKDVKALHDAINAEGRTLIAQEVLPEAATARRDELQVALHRAESALRSAQVNYDSLVAEWRHGP